MAQRQLLRAINRASILNAIKSHGTIARTDIAALTGLSPATITGLTAELIEDGLILEKTEGESRGGRRPILLSLNPHGAAVVGIKLAEEHATLALTDINADILDKHTIQLGSRDPQSISQQLAATTRELLADSAIKLNQLLGVGVGLSGIIDSEAGICRVSPHNDWRDVPFADLLANELDCIVALDNNVNTLTLIEQLYGAGQHIRDFLVVTTGRGVGLGIVTNGAIYHGSTGGAGEFGHMVVDPEGFACSCGNRGCLETFVSEPWLMRRAELNGLNVNNPDDLIALAYDDHPIARDMLIAAGRALGQATANLVNLFNPALIIISGEGVRAGSLMFDSMRETMKRHMFAPLAEKLEIRVEPLGEDTWARGAASLVLSTIFSVPTLR